MVTRPRIPRDQARTLRVHEHPIVVEQQRGAWQGDGHGAEYAGSVPGTGYVDPRFGVDMRQVQVVR